jgi:AcrR family transcriptional regulator
MPSPFGIIERIFALTKNRWLSDLHWVRAGQQTRSQKTQAALLDAAETLFAEQGVEHTSVAAIARQAGCSVGAVYHHFRDKKAVLYALFTRLTDEIGATTQAAVDPNRWQGATIVDIVHGYLEFLLRTEQGKIAFKHLAMEYARQDDELREHFVALQAELDDGLTRLLLARRAEIAHPEPRIAIGFVLDQLSSMLAARANTSLAPTQLGSRPDKRFEREVLRSVSSYLQLATPAKEDVS